ncbi:hypothetical protein K1719_041140 [Acacia pycnantha]|nr:hypothetical protein K1719_041140 [Acacia pycnantha]
MPSSESSNLTPEGEMHKQLDRDIIGEMVTSITSRVANFHKSGHYKEDDDDEDGARIITLAGTNDGATLKSKVDNNKPAAGHHSGKPEEEELSTYVNSNFQAVNNSIMFSGSYQAHDPGVNVEISDFTEPAGHHKAGKHGKKKKKNEISKSDDGDHHHSGHSD